MEAILFFQLSHQLAGVGVVVLPMALPLLVVLVAAALAMMRLALLGLQIKDLLEALVKITEAQVVLAAAVAVLVRLAQQQSMAHIPLAMAALASLQQFQGLQ
jgi:hypothetical protein